MNQTAARIDYQPELFERSVAEQLALNRSVVAAAEDHRLEEAIHPTRWERRGLLGLLRRRPTRPRRSSWRSGSSAATRGRSS